jgi:hypothetical protein
MRIWYTYLAFRKERDDDCASHFRGEGCGGSLDLNVSWVTRPWRVGLTFQPLLGPGREYSADLFRDWSRIIFEPSANRIRSTVPG